MKFKKFLAIPLCLTALCLTACGSSENSEIKDSGSSEGMMFYTNIPQGKFSLLDDSFALGEIIGGYKGNHTTQIPSIDISNYSQHSATLYYMNADAELLVQDDFTKKGAEEKFVSFRNEVKDLLSDVTKSLSSTVEDSDIDKFNKKHAGGEIEVSKVSYEVLSLAKSVYEFTDGSYNPALYYNIQAYGFGGAKTHPKTKDELPDDEDIAKYTSLASHFGEITLREDEGKYFVTKPAVTVEVGGEVLTMKLDLGGIGKGYAVDKVEELFDKYGYEYGYFNFAASSMLVRSHAKFGVYNLSFINPRSLRRDAYMSVEVQNEKFSTSGDFEQYYTIDNTRYCHIISPVTGKPIQTGIMSVTLIGGSAAEDDALTTAIMCMEKDDAVSFIREKLTDRRVTFTYEKNGA